VKRKAARKGAKTFKKNVYRTKQLDLWRATQEYHFQRFVQDGNLITATDNNPAFLDNTSSSTLWGLLGSAVGDVGGYGCMQFSLTCQFALSMVPNASEFVALFNEYRIDKVELKAQLGMGDSYGTGLSGSQLPTMYSVYDSNDSTALTDLPSTQQWANCQEHVLTSVTPYKRTLVCKPAMAVYVNTTTTGYAQPASNKSVWMDTANPSIPHYGFKFWIRGVPTTAAAGFVIRFQPKLYLSFRKPK